MKNNLTLVRVSNMYCDFRLKKKQVRQDIIMFTNKKRLVYPLLYHKVNICYKDNERIYKKEENGKL